MSYMMTQTMRVKAVSSIEAEVEALLERRVAACRAKDIDALMALYAPDIVYFDVVPPLRFVGHDAVRDNFLRWFAEYDGAIGLETREMQMSAAADVAFAHMLHEDSGNRNLPTGESLWVRSTSCCRRSGGKWLITHEHISLTVDFRSGKALVDLKP
jgi:ketosteroid isomerase-like protein